MFFSKEHMFFSKEQIEEIDLLKELCQGISVEGTPIVCFEILSDIAHGKYELSKLSLEDLLLLEEQLLGYIEFWEKAGWLDNQIVFELLLIIQNSIKTERSKHS